MNEDFDEKQDHVKEDKDKFLELVYGVANTGLEWTTTEMAEVFGLLVGQGNVQMV